MSVANRQLVGPARPSQHNARPTVRPGSPPQLPSLRDVGLASWVQRADSFASTAVRQPVARSVAGPVPSPGSAPSPGPAFPPALQPAFQLPLQTHHNYQPALYTLYHSEPCPPPAQVEPQHSPIPQLAPHTHHLHHQLRYHHYTHQPVPLAPQPAYVARHPAAGHSHAYAVLRPTDADILEPSATQQQPQTPLKEQLIAAQLWEVCRTPKKGCYFCSHCNERFFSIAQLVEHIDRHGVHRAFKCRHPGCPWRIVGFNKKSEWKRHMKHQHSTREVQCHVLNCAKKFSRSDSLQRHLRMVHNNANSRRNRSYKSPDQGSNMLEFRL